MNHSSPVEMKCVLEMSICVSWWACAKIWCWWCFWEISNLWGKIFNDTHCVSAAVWSYFSWTWMSTQQKANVRGEYGCQICTCNFTMLRTWLMMPFKCFLATWEPSLVFKVFLMKQWASWWTIWLEGSTLKTSFSIQVKSALFANMLYVLNIQHWWNFSHFRPTVSQLWKMLWESTGSQTTFELSTSWRKRPSTVPVA